MSIDTNPSKISSFRRSLLEIVTWSGFPVIILLQLWYIFDFLLNYPKYAHFYAVVAYAIAIAVVLMALLTIKLRRSAVAK
jgi:hypothetical protein